MENRSHALIAGVFVLVLGCATALAFWYFAGKREDTDSYVLETRRNVTGLNVQGQVRYRGIRAGKVESIEPDPADPRLILVTISLDDRFRVTKATTAQLAYLGVTGLAYVSLEDDGSSAEPLVARDGAPPRIVLRPGLVDALGERAGDMLARFVDLSDRLARVLDEKNAQNLSRTLENAAAGSESFKQMPQLVAAMREALSESNLKRFQGILAHLEKTAGEAAPLTAEARSMVASMTQLAKKLDGLADRGGGDVAATLQQVEVLAKELTANSRKLSRLLDTLDDNPQALIFGKPRPSPGPGEEGFAQ